MFMKTSFSKKIYSIIFTAILILTPIMPFSTGLNVKALSKVDYSLKAENCNKDRLFNVDVYVEGKSDISAVDVEISFNPSYMEFRRVSGANDAFDIQHKVSDGKVSTIILCSYGYSFNSKAKFMTFQFKSLKSGNTAVGVRISDPVNKDLKSIPIGNVYGCMVTVNGDTIKSKTIKTSSKPKSSVSSSKIVNTNKEKGNESDKESSSVTVEYDYEESDEFLTEEESNSVDLIDNTENYPYTTYFIGGIIVIILVIIIYISYRLGRNNQQSDTDYDDEDEE